MNGKIIELNSIYNENNIITLKNMLDCFIDGIITSPPYNISTKRRDCYYNNGYSNIDNLTENEYLNRRIEEFKEFSRVLKNDGVICYNISYHNENPILPILLMSNIHNETDLTVADIITWKKNVGIPFQTSPRFMSRICELIYIIVKKESLHSFKTNKEISKINEKTGQKFYKNYTNLIEAKNNDGIKSKLKASYSMELVDKLINIYFPENSIVYDPFSGLGTTARSCIKNKLNYIGSEIDVELYQQSIAFIKSNLKK
jgi:DNA modification methylase